MQGTQPGLQGQLPRLRAGTGAGAARPLARMRSVAVPPGRRRGGERPISGLALPGHRLPPAVRLPRDGPGPLTPFSRPTEWLGPRGPAARNATARSGRGLRVRKRRRPDPSRPAPLRPGSANPGRRRHCGRPAHFRRPAGRGSDAGRPTLGAWGKGGCVSHEVAAGAPPHPGPRRQSFPPGASAASKVRARPLRSGGGLTFSGSAGGFAVSAGPFLEKWVYLVALRPDQFAPLQ